MTGSVEYSYHTPPLLNNFLNVTVTIDNTDSFAYTSLPFPYGPTASDTPFNCDDCPLQSLTVPTFQYFGAATTSLQFTANGDISPYSGFYTLSYPAPGGRPAPYISAFYYDLYPLGANYGSVSLLSDICHVQLRLQFVHGKFFYSFPRASP